MIPKKYKGDDLIGKKCRTVRNIRNGAGETVSPATVCTIKRVVPGSGFTIQTEFCGVCGQSAYITGVHREDLELIDETPLGQAKELLRKRTLAAQALLSASDEITSFCEELGMDITDDDACLGLDCRIWCETDGAYTTTLDAIQKYLGSELNGK